MFFQSLNIVQLFGHPIANIGQIVAIEKVQCYFTRRLFFDKVFSYSERLFLLNWQPLETRRIKADLIMYYKIIHRLVDLEPENFFTLSDFPSTTGHLYKIILKNFINNTFANSFGNRQVNCWNALPTKIVSASSLSNFKSKLKTFDLTPFLNGRL